MKNSFVIVTVAAMLSWMHRTAVMAQNPTFSPRCGDCWCVPDGGVVDGTCPNFSPGIYQSFPDSWISAYSSYSLTSTPLALQASDGSSNCYPFTGKVSQQVTYAESTYPLCQAFAGDAETSVCGYMYASTSTSSCEGRSYELVTYDSMEALTTTPGAQFIHRGPCGVCSNAQDLAMRMTKIDTIVSQSISCTLPFVFDKDFSKLSGCFQTLGFTEQCATLWAHFSATNSQMCASQCAPSGNQIVFNNQSSPFCEFTACLPCSSGFEPVFNNLGGLWRSAYNAGFNNDIAFFCNLFSRPNLDPCTSLGSKAPVAPTRSPKPTISPAPTKAPTTPAPAPQPVTTPLTSSSAMPASALLTLALAMGAMMNVP